MSTSFQEGLGVGGRLLVPFSGACSLIGLAGERLASVRGEIDLAFTPGATEVSLFRIGLTSPGAEIGEQGALTGHFGLHGISGTGALEQLEQGAWHLHLDFVGVQAYEELTRRIGRTHVPLDRFMAPVEDVRGSFDGILRESDDGAERETVFSGSFRFDSVLGGQLGWVRGFHTTLANAPVWKFFRAESARQVERRRRLKLRPVRLLDRCDDPAPTGKNAREQFEAAQCIWGKCCIDLEILDPIYRVEPELKTSDDPELVMNSYGDPDENTVEIFFVDNPLSSYGGGGTGSCGWNTASVVLTDHSEHNPNLLAHELGHVLAGTHPEDSSSPSTFFWEGEAGTVLEATLYNHDANLERNTLSNCCQARNPALMTPSQLPCQLRPDE